jgi:hypothetical protein
VSYEFYKVLHILGIILVFMSLGGATLHATGGGTRDNNPARGRVAALHGVGLLLLIVAGFGMLARIQGSMALPPWVHPKLLVWVLLGAAPVLISRKPGSAKALWIALPLLGVTAAYFGIFHK